VPGVTLLDDFIALRQDLRAAAVGDGGLDTCSVLTQALDAAVRSLFPDDVEGSAALVAIGSFGRGELCLWSDVDLMLLHDGADPDRLVKAVFYPLWDANLKVGHAVRTPRECAAAARDRIETLTSLLSARLIAGDGALLERLGTVMSNVVSGRPLAPHLADLERERRKRDPYPVIAADVKSGRGALRTFQAFDWERRRALLMGHAPDGETVEERAGRSTLLAVRNGLHSAAGRAFDVYDFDARDQVARWLDSDVKTVTRRLCHSLQLGDRLAEAHWPMLLVSGDPLARVGRKMLGRLRGQRRGEAALNGSGPLGAAARIATASHGVVIDTAARASLGAETDDPWSDAERAAFLTLISSGERGRVVFGWLEQLGWADRHFAEWVTISGMPQLAPFHEHPVDAHLWRATDEIIELIANPDPFIRGILAELGSTDDVVLAAFLHDIGKGGGGDHSEVGAEVAARFLTRAGFESSIVESVTAAVRNHLLLARTASRRDIASPDVIDEVANEVGGLRDLQVLYLLTVADSKATGRTMWSEWKETLLRQLYTRVATRFGAGEEARVVHAEHVAELTGERFTARAVAGHLSSLPGEYAETTDPDDVVWHLEAIAELAGTTRLVVDGSGNRVLVVGRDRRGFLLSICRAFAAHGIGVHDARLYTRGDGVVIDVFEVREDPGGAPVPEERWAKVRETLSGVETGGRDLLEAVRQRAAAYDTGPRASVVVRHRPELSSRHTVLEVRAADRVGLLVDIVEALYDEGLDLHLARIDTRANQAIDVLHVRRSGEAIEDRSVLDDLCRSLERRIGG